MTKRTASRFRAAAILVLFLAVFPARPSAEAVPAELALADQFGTIAAVGAATASGRWIIAYSGERDAGALLAAWVRELLAVSAERADGGDVGIVAAADLSGVPFFVPKSAIVRQLAEEYPDLPLLLDWKGALGKPLGFGKEQTLVVAIKDGAVVAASRSPASRAEARRLREALR